MEKVNKILRLFVERGIDFCVLRNYKNMDNEKDIDILIDFKDKRKIKNILRNLGFRKGADFGFYLSYKKLDENMWFDIRIGCLVYQGFCFEKAKEILLKKLKYEDFFILSKEDEYIHLILHSILDKGYFKENYIKRIEELEKVIDKAKAKAKLSMRLEDVGERVFLLIKNKDYEGVLRLKKRIFRKMFSLEGFYNNLMLKLIKLIGKLR